ncbi:MAG TPA: substrate-binding domain-containing protein, partial [Solirubrobacteraceae bacterium]|nr:substrate-binding domain-containing protein [Solirubrobacteraceae bacterium]
GGATAPGEASGGAVVSPRASATSSMPAKTAATRTVAEHVVAPLIDAFTRRTPKLRVTVETEPAGRFAALVGDRRVDVALGARPAGDASAGLESIPFLRYRLIVVATPDHRLAGRAELAPGALARERRLVGPAGAGPDTAVGAYLARHALVPPEVRAFASEAAALSAAQGGQGLMLAVAHTVVDALRRGALARLDVRDTPIEGLWHATALGPERRSAAAWALLRFITTPEAVHAMLSGRAGVPAGRFRPSTYVTLWS